MAQQRIPVVMTFAGNDPTGGAGIQADIETIASMGCHAAPVVTALTVQDTRNVISFDEVAATLVIEQARAVLEDMPVAAFKLGMLGSIENIEAIHTLLTDYPQVPVVLDPIIAAGGGTGLSDTAMREAMVSLLFPLTTILTPNSQEARRFASEADTLDACGQELLSMGCDFVLITGAHENSPHVENRFYGSMRHLETFTWERLPHSYHGSGCTLASSIAGLLAQGVEPFVAVHEAQEYTWESLKHGYRLGMGQHHPNRLFWARGEEEA
ncbi:bifunctional hydroxymethylpyrimidine kinase/phosphomethylpyrimidine kinase [Thiohalomonas denitrificans]|uniref:hydroxymethylpyrimidine kinase n=1 Tax=Thiohalomonas denitrificans TaxID=415747 RepID=A0A1G5Q8J4_9GAMM|nr:hydroxymethylpyrimidine/phosphomethylpyrimidine kinase [Thiohalomonas denitrificans]SCZ57579.1 hydroxymethylpyrimidine/phosphomethylpyrimidine kinase [Thiohalomonas denitrificans]